MRPTTVRYSSTWPVFTPRGTGLTLSASVYFRHIGTETFNGDLNEDSLDQAVYLPGENALNTPFPFRRCLIDILEDDEPEETCNGQMNRTGHPSA
jgi:hypothetical protein